MKRLKQFLLFLIIFIGTFTASGEAYIFYLNSVSADCDYYFSCYINSDKKRETYAKELKSKGETLDLDIYAIDYKPIAHDSATYTIYTINGEVESLVKDMFKVQGDKEFTSLFSGKREIIFKDISEIKNNARITTYNVMGEKENIDQFRSLTIDEYGTGKAYEGDYSGDHFFILMSSWSLALVIIIFITLIESATLRREVCVKYINGHNKSKLITIEILKNAALLIIAAIVAMIIGNRFTSASAFGIYLGFIIIGIVIISSFIIYLQLRLKDIRKIFSNGANSKMQRVTGIILLAVTLVLFISSLSICLQNINDAYKTINQKEMWNKYNKYESIVFHSSEESQIANYDLDRKYAADFYNRYLNKYDISMAFNVADNGGAGGFGVLGEDTIIYANLNGAKKMALPIDVTTLKRNKVYVILPYSLQEFKEKESWNDLDFVLREWQGKRNIEPKYITIDKSYKTTILDIKTDNLSSNCVKNPIIIIDTFATVNNNFATHVTTSILDFSHEGDFEKFIESINYKTQVWYKDNVYKIYEQKRNTSIMIATVNIVLVSILSLLFFITFYTVLKIEFKYRADEISIRKILGDTLIKRYSFIFNLINMIVIIAVVIVCILGVTLDIIEPIFIVISLGLSYISIFAIFIVFTKIYENRNIPKILKGGY